MCSLRAFSNASARVLQQVQQQMQRLSLNRRAFCKGLAEATALNNAQTMYQIDVGGVSFHTQTEVLHEGMLLLLWWDVMGGGSQGKCGARWYETHWTRDAGAEATR